MRECVKCEAVKSDDCFYPSDRKCKECRKAMVRANRLDKIDHYQEFDRKRSMEPHRVAARAAYASTDVGKAAVQRAKKHYIERNPRKRAAHNAVGNGLRDGSLWKSPCCMAPDCFNDDALHGHHPHYDYLLDVVWLCVPCHVAVHKQFNETIEGEYERCS